MASTKSASFRAIRSFRRHRRPFQEDFLKNFELQVNDGQVLTEAGNPIWESFAVRTNNTDPIATIEIDPPRFLRFIRLRATSSIPFEVEKFQVFGEGFFPTVQYISPLIDMGTPANWGRLRWLEETVGQASAVQMNIRTRSGNDTSPFAYTRKRVGRQDAEEIAFSVDNPDQPLLRDEYLDLAGQGRPRRCVGTRSRARRLGQLESVDFALRSGRRH